MKTKVGLFNQTLLKTYLATISTVSLFVSFAMIAIQVPDGICLRVVIGLALAVLLIVLYIMMWVNANQAKATSLRINNSDIEIKCGDIFKAEGLKVIAFNEYFDTLVDDRIIAASTLNGKFILSNADLAQKIDRSIEADSRLQTKVVEINQNRLAGKSIKYELGSLHQFGDYLLAAFTRFDQDNRAYLSMRDYVDFLINFWNEMDVLYAGKSVSIPLLGSGITRFKECGDISEQELLELLIWSFKISRIKFPYPSKVTILIHESIMDKINFYKLKEQKNGV
ncbi:MAG: hypothetical protein IPP69_16850 [Flavobacteriales bacterium]|nr:hypothetical protein [Flavobacteriales bacterium]